MNFAKICQYCWRGHQICCQPLHLVSCLPFSILIKFLMVCLIWFMSRVLIKTSLYNQCIVHKLLLVSTLSVVLKLTPFTETFCVKCKSLSMISSPGHKL